MYLEYTQKIPVYGLYQIKQGRRNYLEIVKYRRGEGGYPLVVAHRAVLGQYLAERDDYRRGRHETPKRGAFAHNGRYKGIYKAGEREVYEQVAKKNQKQRPLAVEKQGVNEPARTRLVLPECVYALAGDGKKRHLGRRTKRGYH
jgi:hypothetical protein